MVKLGGPLVVGGAALVGAGLLDKDPRRGLVLIVSGAAAAGWGLFRGLADVGEFVGDRFLEQVQDSADTPVTPAPVDSTPAGAALAFFETFQGTIFRVLGKAGGFLLPDSPGIEVDPIRAADESLGPFLGHPRNALRISGVVRSPGRGQRLQTGLAREVFPVDAALENQSALVATGSIVVETTVWPGMPAQDTRRTEIGPVELAPGAFRELNIRAPIPQGIGTVLVPSTVRLKFGGFLLDQVDFLLG